LTNRVRGALIESTAKASKHFDIADGAVGPDDNLELDVAFDASPPCFFGVIGSNFAKDVRRCDARARTIGPASGSTTTSRADT
jgi:hypothetical protein